MLSIVIWFRGIISACAERTSRPNRFWAAPRDHLRVCGADPHDSYVTVETTGSSPRVRSGHEVFHDLALVTGIISACAERTSRRSAIYS